MADSSAVVGQLSSLGALVGNADPHLLNVVKRLNILRRCISDNGGVLDASQLLGPTQDACSRIEPFQLPCLSAQL